MRYTYPAVLTKNELGGYDVRFVDFADACTNGDDVEDAVNMAAEVLYLLLEEYLQQEKPLPAPTFDVEAEGLLVAVSTEIDPRDALVPTSRAAELLHVSAARVRQMVKAGQLASKRQGRDNYVYLWSIKQRQAAHPGPGRPSAS